MKTKTQKSTLHSDKRNRRRDKQSARWVGDAKLHWLEGGHRGRYALFIPVKRADDSLFTHRVLCGLKDLFGVQPLLLSSKFKNKIETLFREHRGTVRRSAARALFENVLPNAMGAVEPSTIDKHRLENVLSALDMLELFIYDNLQEAYGGCLTEEEVANLNGELEEDETDQA